MPCKEIMLVSVIVPVFNSEKYLRECLKSLVNQTIAKEELEVLLIDDGSTDNSIAIAQEYTRKYSFFKLFCKPNGGVSSARNLGIRNATGKYIFYLDADDYYSPETLKSVSDFFDAHYEEIDLIDIQDIRFREDGTFQKPHLRYETLDHTGVYDLTDPENSFVLQTTMNICVKNQYDKNILFDESLTRHEDQKYCIQLLQDKLKIGYCENAVYYYRQHSGSSTHSVFYAYYLFEQTTAMWEAFFDDYPDGKVPAFIQACYLNDLNWKTNSDILLPYHYTKKEFENAKNRLLRLLKQVDDSTILNFPSAGMDPFRKQFFLQLKGERSVSIVKKGSEGILLDETKQCPLYSSDTISCILERVTLSKESLKLMLVLQSPLFIWCPKPELYVQDSNSLTREILLGDSSFDYLNSKMVTNKSYLAEFEYPFSNGCSLSFFVTIGQESFPVSFSTDWRLPFHKKGENKYESILSDLFISCCGNRITIRKPLIKDRLNKHKWFIRNSFTVWLKRHYYMFFSLFQKPCWLYYDCKGVDTDNGYYQFDHDYSIPDGITRYYVINEDNFEECRQKYPPAQRNHLVKFGSVKHKLLFLNASFLITAYIELENYHPFGKSQYPNYSDLCRQHCLVYLQHGVLHAHLPWKYSHDRQCLDYQVISTVFEEENLISNYFFTEESLIKSGMPRYDHIDSEAVHERRILYAPSWRKYLIGRVKNQWIPTEKQFTNSVFFEETQRFLNSPQLEELLERYDYTLDFKLHPIFRCYEKLYTISNPRVHLGSTVADASYGIYISDFSSYTYDFVYTKVPILYFFPDYPLFRSGMNDYRELDIPLEDGLGPLCLTSDELLRKLSELLERNCVPEKKYAEREENFFFYKDNNQCDRIYKALWDVYSCQDTFR